MLKRSVAIAAICLLAIGGPGCIFSPEEKKPPEGCDDCGSIFEELTSPENVLLNLELAYDEQNLNEYKKILDPDFTFFFDPGDVNDPTDPTPQQWGVAEEEQSASNMFNGVPNGEGFAIVDIDLDLVMANLNWIDTTPEDFPDETWKTATVDYSFSIAATQDLTFINSGGAKAQFTVRPQSDGTWKLVEWQDIASSTRVAVLP